MRIVVAGGTGFVGRHLARALLDAGHEVAVLGRDPSKVARIPELHGARALRGDVTDPASLDAPLQGTEAVVAAVQFPNYPMELPRRGLTFDAFDRRGTSALAAAAQRAGATRFLYISGAGADPTSDKTWYRAKGLAEAALQRTGLDVAIVRPSWIYGPGDRALNRFGQIARFSPVVPLFGRRPQLIQPVYIGDVAEAVVRIFERDDSWNGVIEIGGPDVMTMDEIVATMLEVMGIRRRMIVHVPLWIMRAATAPLVLLPKPPMTPGGVSFAAQDGIVDTGKLRGVLDLVPRDLRSGLAEYVRAA